MRSDAQRVRLSRHRTGLRPCFDTGMLSFDISANRHRFCFSDSLLPSAPLFMRVSLSLTSNTEPVPFDRLMPSLTGVVHRWLGLNEAHDAMSLYSIGSLRHGRLRRGALDFPDGSTWTISFLDTNLGKRCLSGVVEVPEVAFGMNVCEAQLVEPPPFEQIRRYVVDSPVLTRRKRDDGSREHLTFRDPESADTLTRTLRGKMEAAGFGSSAAQASARFDTEWSGAKTKVVPFRSIRYRANVCPVIIEGPEEAHLTAFLAGVGELSGCGFGALR